MPCWYYEKEDLLDTPSSRDGIDAATEARYRKEGARFIIDAGTSQGLRYDTMATGVVYFHRFYMFHSFKDFPRYVTGAACLFLAGKVEETPKKCKDIIRIAKVMVPESHFSAFGDDPKEEIMTYERILLQTIKFDLQVDHPYSYLLKYAKTLKGDKVKIQQLVQMAWTFVNDSLCTTLCLQWEPHIVGVAFLYLAGRLSKSDLLEWSGKNTKVKWWEQLADDVSLDIMEDICHLLLDLYSTGQQPKPSVLTSSKATSKRPRPKTPPVAGPENSKGPDDGRGSQQVSKGEKSRDGHATHRPRHPPPPPPSSSSSSSSGAPGPALSHKPGGSEPADKAGAAKAPPPHKDPAPSTPKKLPGAPAVAPVTAAAAPPQPGPVHPPASQSYPGPGSYAETVPTSTYGAAGPLPPVSQGYPPPAYQHPPQPETPAAPSSSQPVAYSQGQYQTAWNYGSQTQATGTTMVPNFAPAAYNPSQPPPGYLPNVPPQVTGINPGVPPPPPTQQPQQQQQQPQQQQQQPPPSAPMQQQVPYSQPFTQYPPPPPPGGQAPPTNIPPPPISVPPPQVNMPPPAHNMSVPPPRMNQPPPLMSQQPQQPQQQPPPLMGQPPPAQRAPSQPQPFPNFPPPLPTAGQGYSQPPPHQPQAQAQPPPKPQAYDMIRLPGPGAMQGTEGGFGSKPPMGLATVRITGRDGSWGPQRRGSHGGAGSAR